MKAILFDEPGDESVLKLGDAPSPAMQPGSLRLKVAAAAVNRGDLLQRKGHNPPPPGASEIIGLECAGEVVEMADDVTGWKPGDRAMALLPGGGYAEEVVVHAGSAMPVPERLSFEEAAAVPEVFLTVHLKVFMLGRFPDGGSLLVHGGGSGIGTCATQLVKQVGGQVVVTAGSDEKCAQCLKLGADVAVNYNEADFVQAAKDATGGKGVDLVLDSIGGPYLERNLQALAPDGRLVIIGLMGGAKAEINLGLVVAKRLQVIGSTLRARPVEEKAEIVRSFLDRFGAALDDGRIGPVVDEVFPLANAADAHRKMNASDHFGKLVLKMG
ncbi:MAG: NAD(P)H-quinone oxidoreductase [Pseudomonadota bacterium]